MKKTLCITTLLLLSVISLMADNTAIVGTWSTLTVGREMDYYKFTEDNKCSHWVTVASSETGELKTYWDYTDVPYTYDEENMILTVNISDGTTKLWEFDSISADRFVVKGDWISYYRENVNAIESLAIESAVSEIYILDGSRAERLGHGVNLIRKSDGTVGKVYVK